VPGNNTDLSPRLGACDEAEFDKPPSAFEISHSLTGISFQAESLLNFWPFNETEPS
jgi:hypothetical protein